MPCRLGTLLRIPNYQASPRISLRLQLSGSRAGILDEHNTLSIKLYLVDDTVKLLPLGHEPSGTFLVDI